MSETFVFVCHKHCQKLGTRWRLRVRTKAIMAANSYKKMYGDCYEYERKHVCRLQLQEL